MDAQFVIAFAVGLLILCLFTKVFSFPLRLLWRAIYNSIIGAVILYLVNIFGIVHIEITFLKALFCGVFGLPGVILIVILHLL